MRHPIQIGMLLLMAAIAGCNSTIPTESDRADGASAGPSGEALNDLRGAQPFAFDFAVRDLDGRSHQLADYRGKVLIVDCWGTWCPPCRQEIPSFIKLQSQFGPDGLQVFGLNYEHESGQPAVDKVRQFATAHGINYPCALGSEDIKNQIPGFRGYPTTLFIDRTGRVRLKIVGLHDYEYLEAVVRALLSESG